MTFKNYFNDAQELLKDNITKSLSSTSASTFNLTDEIWFSHIADTFRTHSNLISNVLLLTLCSNLLATPGKPVDM